MAARYLALEDLLREADVDAVDIVTGEAAHGEHARLALEAGRCVFVEKPLATRLDEAEAVEALAEQTGLPVCVGNISRFDPRYAFLRRECEAGGFGRVVLVSAQRTFSRAWFAGFGSRVHPVFESMIHDLDLALWYLPSPRAAGVRAVGRVGGRRVRGAGRPRRHAHRRGRLARDPPVDVAGAGRGPDQPSGTPCSPFDLWGTIDGRLDLVGTAQTGRVNVLGDGLSVWSDEHHRAPDVSLWPEVHGRVTGALREELAHWLDCVRAGRRSPIAPLEDSVSAVRLAEAIVRSAGSGAPVELDDPVARA